MRDSAVTDVPRADATPDVGPTDADQPDTNVAEGGGGDAAPDVAADVPVADTAPLDAPVDAPAAVCGNGTREPSEPCDGTDLNAATCATRGFRAGVLHCLADCTGFDERACTNVRINEVESNPNPDWLELYNPGPGAADLTGYTLSDNDPTAAGHIFTFAPGTTIPAAGFLAVLSGGDAGIGFGLGAPDAIRFYEPGGTVVDEIAWTAHMGDGGVPAGTYARCPNGSDTVVEVTTPTQGASNSASCP